MDEHATASSIPNLKHLAIIMDGNGRWAAERGMNRFKGHIKGTEAAEKVIEECVRLKIPYLTMFAFSTENWSRPKREVDFLFSLLEKHLNERGDKLVEQNIRVQTIGDLTRLPLALQKSIELLKQKSSKNTGLTLIFGLNYGGRSEIVRGALNFLKACESDQNLKNNLDEESFKQFLETSSWPDPDLVIRTSGEQRISNFMIWQMAYSELYFTHTLWPDFTPEELSKALSDFCKRQRRFGCVEDCKNSQEELNISTTKEPESSDANPTFNLSETTTNYGTPL